VVSDVLQRVDRSVVDARLAGFAHAALTDPDGVALSRHLSAAGPQPMSGLHHFPRQQTARLSKGRWRPR
jgi:hypothetical protein